MGQPTLHVVNRSSNQLLVGGDPDWDEQVVLVDGKKLGGDSYYPIGVGNMVTVSTPDSVGPDDGGGFMGLLFGPDVSDNYYQLIIGQVNNYFIFDNVGTILGPTVSFVFGKPLVSYHMKDISEWAATMVFVDSPEGSPVILTRR